MYIHVLYHIIHIMYHICICTYMIIYIIYIYNHNMNVIASAGHHVQESTSPRDPFACRFFRPALNEALKALDTLSGKEIAEVKAWQKALVV